MSKKPQKRKIETKTIRRGLSLYKTDSSPFWYARIWLSGERKYLVRSTKETSRLNAADVAEELLHDIKQNRFVDAIPREKLFIHYADMLVKEQRRIAGKTKSKRFAIDDESILHRKGDGVVDYFGRRDVSSITTADIRKYLNYLDDRRDKPLAPATKNRQMIVIRKVLRLAYEHGVIDNIPLTPKITIKDNPRPSFTEQEYKHLLKTTRQVVKEGVKVRGITITMEMYYFIVFMTHSFLRPTETEVFALRHRDILEKQNPRRLEIKVQGKTGYRVAMTTKYAPVFYKHLQTKINPEYESDDFVFFPDYPNRTTSQRNVNRQFTYLLERSGLKTTPDGTRRSVYSLRHYALQTRLRKSGGKVNIYTLARVAGTSVEQLERFYLKNMEFNDDMAENFQTEG
jgi:site-specific recombinase XerD